MSTSKATVLGGGTKKFGIVIAGTVALLATVATTTTVSLQDIAELTGTKTALENRWLARLVFIPKGSDHSKVEYRVDAYSKSSVRHAMGVQTSEKLHSLDPQHQLASGRAPYINRALKGERVYVPAVKQFNLAAAAPGLMNADTLVTGSISQQSTGANDLVALAQAFLPTQAKVEVESAVDAAASNRSVVPIGQMKQARAAARMMAKVVDQVQKEQIIVAANPAVRSSVSSYAPQERDVASAFTALLRPSLKKEEAKKSPETDKSDSKTSKVAKSFEKAVRKKRRSLIRLAKGDHKWAAKPLPKLSYSRNQRRCLASGVYFEARSEPIKGQQAVAQVILNRVKNPTYPNTICGVVYQNKWKRNACQFSFACDGIRDRVNSRKHWRIATKVANDAIDGRFWLRSVGSSSHYHADYVWPKWRKKMRKMVKIGRHIFYRTYGGGWS